MQKPKQESDVERLLRKNDELREKVRELKLDIVAATERGYKMVEAANERLRKAQEEFAVKAEMSRRYPDGV